VNFNAYKKIIGTQYSHHSYVLVSSFYINTFSGNCPFMSLFQLQKLGKCYLASVFMCHQLYLFLKLLQSILANSQTMYPMVMKL